jgi:hypothetical protein
MDLKVSGGLIPENTSPYDVTATYTVGTILDVLAASKSTAFTLGIDVNTASGQPIEILDLFTMDILGSNVTGTGCTANIEFCFGTTTNHPFVLSNNGNGFSDSLLFGFNLAGFDPTAVVAFHAIVSQATDGREEFFFIPAGTPAAVPEPATLFLVGSGLVGIGAWGRKKRFLRGTAS